MIETYNKLWGYELWIENNSLYCGKHLHVLPNKWCSVHYHKIKKETFYVINGALKLHYSSSLDLDEWKNNSFSEIVLEKGQSYTIDPFIAHRFSSALAYSCDFIEISTHHEETDSYRIIHSV
jgi:mannose-6-phosphate isomerase-like protein (cupin superfamily)